MKKSRRCGLGTIRNVMKYPSRLLLTALVNILKGRLFLNGQRNGHYSTAFPIFIPEYNIPLDEFQRVEHEDVESNRGAWVNIGMDEIEDKDVGRLWAIHYPKRDLDVKSKNICIALYTIVIECTQTFTPYGSWSGKLHYAIAHFEVPKDEFYHFGKEIEEP